jgi:3-polyprenyl-4-hydroxybenzoate decarboxylase
MPGVVDLWSYGETGYHSLAAAVVRERYRREAMVSGFRILGEGQLSLTKFLLLTDRPVDLHDFKAVLEHVLERTRIETDLFVFPNLSMDTLDYAGPRLNEGSKGLLMGLGEPVRTLPRELRGSLPPPFVSAQVFCGGCLVVEGPEYSADPSAASVLAKAAPVAEWPLVVLTDDAARASASTVAFLWTTFTRFDPAYDLHGADLAIAAGQLVRRPPLVIDARRKPRYPAELTCDPATSERVTRRWSEYFPGGLTMGDTDGGDLRRPPSR